jgi:AcrR family transcriptional regulator
MDSAQRSVMGRPRGFDADQALERALEVFWRQGYEGATLTDLTEAMGITRTSMYAAYGNKDELFRRALERYTLGPASYGVRALEEPTARAVAEHVLRGAVQATTRPDRPAGCLCVQGALATGEGGQAARDALVAWRRDGEEALRARFARARDEGDLPAGSDPSVLARYISTVVYGMAVQAATGVPREDLRRIIDLALQSWPAGPAPSHD